jgi:hypothetical protein
MKTKTTLKEIAQEFILNESDYLLTYKEAFADMLVLNIKHYSGIKETNEEFAEFSHFVVAFNDLLNDLQLIGNNLNAKSYDNIIVFDNKRSTKSYDEIFNSFLGTTDGNLQDSLDSINAWKDSLFNMNMIALKNITSLQVDEANREMRKEEIELTTEQTYALLKSLWAFYSGIRSEKALNELGLAPSEKQNDLAELPE